MSFRPGTVSKILWHFTGGPLWDQTTNKQLEELKPSAKSFDALKSIINSKELRLGNYLEVVKIIVPEFNKYNRETRQKETFYNHPVEVKSKEVCCVADIPLQHISYHANRYGKIAIGFHRKSIVTAGFNPVMYTLENTKLLRTIYKSYADLRDLDTFDAENELDSMTDEITTVLENREIDEDISPDGVVSALSDIQDSIDEIEGNFREWLSFIKTHDDNEFDTIYCEREWRSTNSFKFQIDDIAMIVLPKSDGGVNYYKEFIDQTDLPRTVTIAAWEDLIEH